MEKEINIKKLLYVIRKRVWIIILLATLFSVFGGIYSVFFTKPLYESSSQIIVNADPDLKNTLIVLIKDPTFLVYVVDKMGLNREPEVLSQQITAESIGGSSIIKISVVDTNPELAVNIADTTAKEFQREIPNLLGFKDIKILSKAKISLFPININHEKKILLGFLVGFIAGIGLIFLLDFFDDTVRSERDVEKLLGIPVLGSVPKMKKNVYKKEVSLKVKVKENLRGESHGTYE